MTGARAAGSSVLAVLGGLLAWNLIYIARHGGELRPTEPGELAPEIRVPSIDLDRPDGSLSALGGQVVLVDFWATWCVPCRRTLPELEALYEKYAARGFTILSINTDGDARARKFRDAFEPHLTFPIYFDATGEAGDRYHADEIPHLVLIDRQGRLTWVHVGDFADGGAELEARIQALLGGS